MTTQTIRRSARLIPLQARLVVGLCGLALYAGSASAGVGTCVLGDGARQTGWSISYDDTLVSACSFVGKTEAASPRNKGTLSLTLKIKDKNPIPIAFVQSQSAQFADSSFGFRISWNLTLINTFQTLKGIRGQALDPNPELDEDINEFVSDDHPGVAHFHQDPALAPFFNPGPFIGAEGCDCESDRDFKVEGRAFAPSTIPSAPIKSIGVHQIEQRGLPRSFTVRLVPRLAD